MKMWLGDPVNTNTHTHTHTHTHIYYVYIYTYILYVYIYMYIYFRISLVVQWGFPNVSVVKNPSAMQETQEMWIRSLDQEDPLEKKMATYSSILAWRIP